VLTDHPNLTKALALAELGLWVFPCYAVETLVQSGRDIVAHKIKSPVPWRGFYEAAVDEAGIRELWKERPNAIVGVWTGKSGIVVMDIDISPEKGKDGHARIRELGLYVPPTLSYETRSGGEHRIHDAGDLMLPPSQDHPMEDGRKVFGVDRRSGGSYIIWWGPVPKNRDDFLPPPEWFSNATALKDAAYRGSIEDWYAALPEGEPDSVVRRILSRIPKDGFSHAEMIKIQTSLALAGAEGHKGVAQAIEEVSAEYLSGDYSTPVWQRAWDQGMSGAIARFGGTQEHTEPDAEAEDDELPDVPEEEFDPDAEPETPEYLTRFQKVVSHRLTISLEDLAQALEVACSRVVPNWEEVRETETVSTMLRQCLRLLTAVQTEEDATKWLSKTKQIMRNVLGEHRG
jgi:hypothetical protein